MRKKLFSLITGLIVLSAIFLLANDANAQNRRARGNVYSKQYIEQLLERIEERTDAFSNQLNKSLDRSGLDGTRAEDNITERAADLENATDELRREFDHNDSRGENKPEARKIMNRATVIDRILKRRNFGRATENNWLRLRSELNLLARIYNLPTVGSRTYR